MFKTWLAVLTKPVETFKAEIQNNKGMADGAAGYVIAAVFAALITLVMGLVFGFSLDMSRFGLAISGPFVMAALVFVAVLVFSFIEAGLIHIGAKLLGGKGSFSKFYYLTSTFAAPILMASFVASFIPCAGSVISLILSAYSIYLFVISLRELHGFSTMRALCAWLLPMVVVAIIMVLVMVVAMGSIAMLGFFPSMSTDTKQAESGAYWRSARPFLIVQSSQIAGSSQLSLRLQNVEARPLTITDVSVKSSERSGTYGTLTPLQGGEITTLTIPLLGSPCRTGDTYGYQLTFSYDDPGGVPGQKQYGAKELNGKCT